MEKVRVKSWEELEARIAAIREERQNLMAVRQRPASPLLFRGHGDAEWKLETTLERAGPHIRTFAQYYRLVSIAKPQVETFSTHRWDLPDMTTLTTWADEYDNLKLNPLPGYDYLVYLRHHGFPSPLLDWTRSLYVAAFFAFGGQVRDDVAINVLLEDTAWGKAATSNRPQLSLS